MASTGFNYKPNVVRPPDKGSFPIDHLNICKNPMQLWFNCMKENEWKNEKCRSHSAAYLQCRIDNSLMDSEEIKSLGFSEAEWNEAAKIYKKRNS